MCVICFPLQFSGHCVDVIFVLDQSSSMEPERDWLTRMVSEIESDLKKLALAYTKSAITCMHWWPMEGTPPTHSPTH